MSWLSGLAGKAEELLNKVDQSAGQSLNSTMTDDDGSAQTAQMLQQKSDPAIVTSIASSSRLVSCAHNFMIHP